MSDKRYFDENKGDTGDTGATGATGAQGQTGKMQRPAIIGFLFLSIGTCLGIWFTGQHASEQLKNKINTVVTLSCKAERQPGSTTNKFNDLIESILEVRTATRDQAVIDRTNAQLRQDKVAAEQALATININQAAINRYKKNLIIPKTDKECEIPIIK